MSKPALKRKQTRRTAPTASLTENTPPPTIQEELPTPQEEPSVQQPDNLSCWEHDMPSDDDVFIQPKKKAVRAIVYNEEEDEEEAEETESDTADPPPKPVVQKKLKAVLKKPAHTPKARGGGAESRPSSPRPAAASSAPADPSTPPRAPTPFRTSSPVRASPNGPDSPIGASTPSPRPRPRSSLFSASPQQTEPMVRGPKRGSDILCWLEPEFIRRGIAKPYRKCVLVDSDFIGEPLVSIYTVLRIETAGDPEDENSVLWQPIKKGGSVLTVNQWNILCDNMSVINSKIERLDSENV